MTTKYLFVEDNDAWRNLISHELRRSTSTTELRSAVSGEEALAILKQEPDIDLVILDLDLRTDMYGTEVLNRIRKFSNVPVVVLTSDDKTDRQIEAFEMGADGYMDKELFDPIQIRKYIEAIRKKRHSGGHSVPERYSFEGWILNTANRQLFNPDRAEVTLTSLEFDLLRVFVENSQTVLTREELIKKVWAGSGKDPQAALKKVLTRLRRKIDMDSSSASKILNVRGRGFHFTPAVAVDAG